MADHPTEAAPVDTFQLPPRPTHDSSATGLAFWTPFALVSVACFLALTQLAAA